MENPIAEVSAKTEQDMLELMTETKKAKKRKKRKREEEPSSVTVRREGVPAHLEPPGQDEDWCLGETWRINQDGGSEKPKQQPNPTTEPKPSQAPDEMQLVLRETPQNHHDSTVKKNKKKHKEKLNVNINHETFNRLVVFSAVIPSLFTSLTHITDSLR